MISASEPINNSLNARVVREINALRGRYGVSQEVLADLLGLAQPQLSRRLRGIIPLSLPELEKIAEYFGLTATRVLMMADISSETLAARPEVSRTE